MRTSPSTLTWGGAGICVLAVAACDLFGGGTGVCVSGVSGVTGRVYCYDDYDRGECAERDDQEVNGARWHFHAGQTCADRGLQEGSNSP